MKVFELLGKHVELPREYDWEKWVRELEDLPECDYHCITLRVEDHNKLVRRIRGLALVLSGGGG